MASPETPVISAHDWLCDLGQVITLSGDLSGGVARPRLGLAGARSLGGGTRSGDADSGD